MFIMDDLDLGLDYTTVSQMPELLEYMYFLIAIDAAIWKLSAVIIQPQHA